MRIVLLITTLGFALLQPVAAEDLLEIYRLAQKSDPTYRAAQQEFFAVEESKNQSFALFLPVLGFSANYSDINREFKTSGASTDYTSQSYSLTLNQAIFHNDYFVQYRQADFQVAQAAANFNSSALDLIVRVSTAYFEVLGAIDNLTFSEAELKAIGEQLHQTKQRFKVGLTAITDVHEAQSRYDQSNAQTIAAKNLLAVNRENLREVTGQYPQSLSELARDTPLVKPDPDDIEQWAKIAADQSLILIAADKAMQIAREEVNRRRSGHYPTLDLIASAGYTKDDGPLSTLTNTQETNDTRIGLVFNLPIYQGGLVLSQTDEAAYRYQQSQELYEQQRRATDRQTRSSYLNVISNISSVVAFKQALLSTRTALEATQAGYEVGTRTAVDLLNSRREVFRAERDYARSRYTYIVETLRLKQAAGTLTEDSVVAINQWLK
jgi:outer membrane protein